MASLQLRVTLAIQPVQSIPLKQLASAQVRTGADLQRY